jgi:nitrite reductase/ring-hydroxylating ferredoxin subunit
LLSLWDYYDAEIATLRRAMSAGADEFEAVARVADVPEGGVLGVARANGERICLTRCRGELYAFQDECTHQAFPLSAGALAAGDDCRIECIWHGAQFDLATGAPVKGPAVFPLTRYDVRVENGIILIGAAAGGRMRNP